jgi:hypothetical protein
VRSNGVLSFAVQSSHRLAPRNAIVLNDPVALACKTTQNTSLQIRPRCIWTLGTCSRNLSWRLLKAQKEERKLQLPNRVELKLPQQLPFQRCYSYGAAQEITVLLRSPNSQCASVAKVYPCACYKLSEVALVISGGSLADQNLCSSIHLTGTNFCSRTAKGHQITAKVVAEVWMLPSHLAGSRHYLCFRRCRHVILLRI